MVSRKDWIRFELSPFGTDYAVLEAVKREKGGKKHAEGLPNYGVDYLGAAGEIAVSEYLGVPYNDSPWPDDKFDARFGGKRIDVKTTFHRTGGLVEFAADRGILCYVDKDNAEVVWIIGWIDREEWVRKCEWKDGGKGGKFKIARQEHLHSMPELLDWYDGEYPPESVKLTLNLRASAREKLKSLPSSLQELEEYANTHSDPSVRVFCEGILRLIEALIRLARTGEYSSRTINQLYCVPPSEFEWTRKMLKEFSLYYRGTTHICRLPNPSVVSDIEEFLKEYRATTPEGEEEPGREFATLREYSETKSPEEMLKMERLYTAYREWSATKERKLLPDGLFVPIVLQHDGKLRQAIFFQRRGE